jgi:hypothetical protein
MRKIKFISTGGLTVAAQSPEAFFGAMHANSFEAAMPFSEYYEKTALAVTRWSGENVVGLPPAKLLHFMLEHGIAKVVEEHRADCPFIADGVRAHCECSH